MPHSVLLTMPSRDSLSSDNRTVSVVSSVHVYVWETRASFIIERFVSWISGKSIFYEIVKC